MMEKAIKQRLLGGLVLVAGAALFLPVLLDGSGAALTIPPLPAAPEVGSVEAMAPRLDQRVAEADQAVDAAHAGRDAVAPADAAAAPVAGGDVAPDAAALAAEEGAAAPAPATTAALPAAAVAPARPAAPVAVAPRPAPAPAPKPAPVPAPKVATPAPKPVEAKPAEAKPAEARPAAPKPAATGSAWVVQVAVLSSRDKAQALVQQLRRKGYPAVMSPFGGNFKVQVGPELDRGVADSIKARLAADPELRLGGWVQPYRP